MNMLIIVWRRKTLSIIFYIWYPIDFRNHPFKRQVSKDYLVFYWFAAIIFGLIASVSDNFIAKIFVIENFSVFDFTKIIPKIWIERGKFIFRIDSRMWKTRKWVNHFNVGIYSYFYQLCHSLYQLIQVSGY